MLSRLRHEDDGVSLADLLVACLLVGLLSAMCMTAAIAASRTTKKTQDRTVAVAALQQAVQRAARHLRAVNPLVTASATGFTANEPRNGSTWFVAVDTPVVDGRTQLRYREWSCAAPPCLTQPAGDPAVTQVWLRDLLAPTGAQTGGSWFRYQSQVGLSVTTSTTPAPPLSSVFAVDVAFRSAVPGLPPIESGTVVAVRNSTASTDVS